METGSPKADRSGPELRAASLNLDCFCETLDTRQLARELARESGDPDFYQTHVARRPHLLSGVPVFAPQSARDAMLETITAIEAVVRTPSFQARVLEDTDIRLVRDRGPVGVFMGYDFHLHDGPPKLIEINTNAGGAFLNAASARAHKACCAEMDPALNEVWSEAFEENVMGMFRQEWMRSGRLPEDLQRIAIVDNDPSGQFLYPEFLLARKLFERHGVEAMVIDPSDLQIDATGLTAGGVRLDLVYNRLTDFSLSEPRHAVLRRALLDDCVVITPDPRAHALYADKRNLALLSDPEFVSDLNVGDRLRSALSTIPRAVLVTPETSQDLWRRRGQVFFKPISGYGGKAVYRGDKITRRVWEDILQTPYIAQDLAAPGERRMLVEGATVERKMDVRIYTYDGAPLLAAARLYQGQTTNFRTPGGGFAPVFFV
jgi:hypothetical protein